MDKIAYLVDSVIPSQKANSVHAVKMSRAFSKVADVTLFCKTSKNEQNNEKILESYGVEKNFDIITIPACKNNKFTILADGYKTAQLVKKHKYNYIYGRSALSVFFSKNIAPFMFESHEWPTNNLMKNLQKIMFKSANFRGLVTISGELKQKYLSEFSFLKEESVHVLHDGADVASLDVKKVNIDNTSNAVSDVVIGYLGHLYPGKCMEIVSELAKIRPQYVFHIAGGTDECVKEWKTKLAADSVENVVLYGYIDNKEADNWYNTFDVFLLPLMNNVYVGGGTKKNIGKWISPLKLFEAMAYGKAILSSDLPTLREVLEDEKDGFLVSPDEISEWGKKLDLLVNDSELRIKLGNAAKSKLEEAYTWDSRAEKILSYMKEE